MMVKRGRLSVGGYRGYWGVELPKRSMNGPYDLERSF